MANGNKAPKGWLIAALISFLLGVGGCGLGAVTAGQFAGDLGDDLSTTPYGSSRSFSGSGDTGALILASDGTATCDVTDEDGNPVDVEGLASGTEVSSDGLDGVGTFTVDDGVTYDVFCDGIGTGEFAVVSVDLSDVFIIAGGLLGGGFFLFLAFVFLIIGLIRRSGWKKKQRLGGGPGGPGGYTPPAPGYGTPPAPGGYGTPPAPGAAPQPGGWGTPPPPTGPAPEQPGWGAPPAPGQTPPPPGQGNWGAPPPPGQS